MESSYQILNENWEFGIFEAISEEKDIFATCWNWACDLESVKMATNGASLSTLWPHQNTIII